MLARVIASLRESCPRSLVFRTVKVAGTILPSRLRSSSLRRIPFFNGVLLVIFDVKRFLKSFKNIGATFILEKFTCIAVNIRNQQGNRYKAST